PRPIHSPFQGGLIVKTFVMTAVAAAVFLSISSARAAETRSLTATEIYLSLQTDDHGSAYLTAATTLAAWCANAMNGVDIGSFQAAQAIEAQKPGLIYCKGEMVNTPFKSRVQVFKLESCEAKDAETLRKSCP